MGKEKTRYKIKKKKSWFDEHVIVLCDDDSMKQAIENKIKKDILKEEIDDNESHIKQKLGIF